MTEQTHTSLKDLQKLDARIEDARDRVSEVDELLEAVAEPAAELEGEVENTEGRIREMEMEERGLERRADEKRVRSRKLQERLKAVRNVREEAAVHAELDIVRQALEGDEQEALSLLDQIRKLEERLEEQREALEAARQEVEPRRQELLDDRRQATEELQSLRERREEVAGRMDPRERKVYETIRAGGRDVAVAELTPDGACGHCYSMVPLQLRNEIRHGSGMIRCEQCGVILAPAPAEDA